MEAIINRTGIVALLAAALLAFAAVGASNARADGPPESPRNAAIGVALTILEADIPTPDESGPVLEVKEEDECVQIHKEFPCPEDEAEEDGPGDGCAQIHKEFPCPEPGEDEDEDTALQCVIVETQEPCESPDPGPDQAGDDGPYQLCIVVGVDDEGKPIIECPDDPKKDGVCELPEGEDPQLVKADPDCLPDGECTIVLTEPGDEPWYDPDCPQDDPGDDLPQREPECIREFKGDCEDNPGDRPGDDPGDEPQDDPGDRPEDEPGDEPLDEPEDQPLVEEDEPAGKLVPGAPDAGGGNALGGGIGLAPILAALALAIGGGILGGAALSIGRR